MKVHADPPELIRFENGGLPTDSVMSSRRGYPADGAKGAVSPRQQIDQRDIVRSVEKAEKMADLFDRHLKFEFREEAGLYQVSVIDDSSDDERVVRKIPPDEVVHFIEHINEMFGALLDMEA